MKSAWLRRAGAWLAALWAGSIAALGFVAAPALFSMLARADAGRVAARLFEVDAQLGVFVGAVLLVACLRIAQDGPSRFSGEAMLSLGALFCIVFGYYGTEPLMAPARLGQGPLSFAALHGVASVFFLLKFVLVGVLAWRLGGRAKAAVPTS